MTWYKTKLVQHIVKRNLKTVCFVVKGYTNTCDCCLLCIFKSPINSTTVCLQKQVVHQDFGLHGGKFSCRKNTLVTEECFGQCFSFSHCRTQTVPVRALKTKSMKSLEWFVQCSWVCYHVSHRRENKHIKMLFFGVIIGNRSLFTSFFDLKS